MLEYGGEIWFNGTEIYEMENIPLKYITSTLGVRSQNSTLAAYGDTEIFLLLIRIINYWMYLLELNPSNFVAYNMPLDMDSTDC